MPRRFPQHRFYFVEWIGALARWRATRSWQWLTGTSLIGDERPQRVDWVTGALMLVPTQAYLSVDGMDERFHMYMEEVDLQWRLRQNGVPAVYLPMVHARHEQGGSTAPSDLRIEALLNARLLYELKWNGWPAVRRLQLLLTLANLLDMPYDVARFMVGRTTGPIARFMRRTRLVWSPPQANRRLLR
jgi:N-acetylglucosaminyl-diphospho-decaprenol L-rhamnosyltransferase